MGIGNAIAQLFAQEGARVVAADIDEHAGAATARRFRRPVDLFFSSLRRER